MNAASLKILTLQAVMLAALLMASANSFAQDASDDATAAPSMSDVLNSVEQTPDAPPAAPTPTPPPAATNADLQRITPAPGPKPAIPTGTMVKPTTTDSAPTENVPAQPLENMNPALMPQAPADEAPKAVRAETAPVPPKPPAYEARPYVTLQTLDKVTARTATMTVKVGDTVAIGPLFVQVKTCQKAAPLETPDSAAFLQIWEAKPKDASLTANSTDKGPSQWVFSGWMFASSPALSAMDHPIYDIWVLNCKKSAKDDDDTSAAVKKTDPATPTGKDDKAASDSLDAVVPDETPSEVSPDVENSDGGDEAPPDTAPAKPAAKAASSKTE